MPDIPNNYESTDCTGVQTGNSDLGVPEWAPPTRPAEQPPQVYPSPSQANVPEKKS